MKNKIYKRIINIIFIFSLLSLLIPQINFNSSLTSKINNSFNLNSSNENYYIFYFNEKKDNYRIFSSRKNTYKIILTSFYSSLFYFCLILLFYKFYDNFILINSSRVKFPLFSRPPPCYNF